MTITLPTSPGIASAQFKLQSNTASGTSPYNLSEQTVEWVGNIWVATFTLPPMTREKAGQWKAALVSLRGKSGRFWGFDPAMTTPVGVGGGSPVLASGVSIGDTSLSFSGGPLSTTGWLVRGDYFQIGDELKMVVTSDVNTNGSGGGSITFEPPARAAHSPAAGITINTPKCKMRLLDDNQAFWDTKPPSIHEITFTGVESFT